MTLAPGKDCKKFGSSCDLSEKFFKEAVNGCGILEKVLARGMEQHNKTLAKTDGKKKARLTGVAKLDDANEAGGKNGYKCTLIITEGDSAKALAVSGLSVVGRDHYGIFPLRGKLLNVRDAPSTTIANNKEITELKQILGLQQGKDYSDAAALKSLRYGHLMIMTDQDHDGSHIKGLIINFLHCYWPALLKQTDFLREFVTPIVKVSKGKQSQPFFTLKEYDDWREASGASISTVRPTPGDAARNAHGLKNERARLPQPKNNGVAALQLRPSRGPRGQRHRLLGAGGFRRHPGGGTAGTEE